MKLFSKIAYHSTTQKGLKEFKPVTDDKLAYSGEGAMVHGWGLYLQEDKELNIENYKNTFSDEVLDTVYEITIKNSKGNTLILYARGYDEDDIDYLMNNEDDYFGLWQFYTDESLTEPYVGKEYEILCYRLLMTYSKDTVENMLNVELDVVSEDENNNERYIEKIKNTIKFNKTLTEFDYTDVGTNSYASQYTVEIPDDMNLIDESEYVSESLVNELVEYFDFYTDVKFEKDVDEVKKEMSKKYPQLDPDTFGIESYNRYTNNILQWMLKKNYDLFGLPYQESYGDDVLNEIYSDINELGILYHAMIDFTNTEPYEMKCGYNKSQLITTFFSNRDKVTGFDFYNTLRKCYGLSSNGKQASEWLTNHGIDGMHYDGEIDGSCYVIYNCKKLKIIKEE